MPVTAGYGQRCGIKAEERRECREDFVDRLCTWLEKEDTPLDLVAGYGICAFGLVFLVLRVIMALCSI